MLGGFVLVRSYTPLDVVRLPSPPELACALVHPHVEVNTEDARRILRSRIMLRDAVVQWGNTAGLVAGLATGDYALIGRSIRDVIIEPVRSMLIPGFDAVKAAAMESGALGCSISGSGPSIFALCRGEESAADAAGSMKAVYNKMGISADAHVSLINRDGPVVLDAPP
jgi:homoserine kinase